MQKFRKKPVVIDALQLSVNHSPTSITSLSPQGDITGPDIKGRYEIRTMEGLMTAAPGDWIIKGIRGEFYPCKDEIFKATYEPVS